MNSKKLLALAALLAVAAACGEANVEGEDGVGAAGDELVREVPAEGLLAFVNNPATDLETLDVYVGLDARAARSILQNRPFASLEALDATPYVGPVTFEKLEAFALSIGVLPKAAPGTYDGVAFDAEQAETVVEIANLATEAQLRQAGLDARQVRHVIAARPIASPQALALVGYVGPRAMEDLRAFVAVWNGERLLGNGALYDGVAFGPMDREIALEIVNNATYEQLVVIGGLYQYGAKLTVAGRPYANLSLWTKTPGIGPNTSTNLLGYARTGRWTRVASAQPGELTVTVEHEELADGQVILGITGDAGRAAAWTLEVGSFVRTGTVQLEADGWAAATVEVPAEVAASWADARISVAYAD